MEGDSFIERYERSAEDVSSIIKHAKLNEKNLTDITQTLYYPSEDRVLSNFKLLELTPHLLSEIEDGKTISFKGGLNDKLVLCSDEKTYDVKLAEISNSLLLVPGLKNAQSTSKRQLKSPKSNANNRSMDSSFEDDDLPDTSRIRQIEHRDVLTINHEYFECKEINSRFRRLGELLDMTRYSGQENEYCIDRSLLFTSEQLLNTIQCSKQEFLKGLQQYRTIEIDGRLRILDYQYEYRVVTLMLGVVNENSWAPDQIDKIGTITALRDIVPEKILNGVFDLYTIPNDHISDRYQYCEKMICQIIAQNILQQGHKFHIDEFMNTWQEALPDGMKINEKYLNGIGVVDRDANVPSVKTLIESNLPTNILDRLKVLFRAKEKWTLDQIEPYILFFTTPQLTVTSLLAKYARSLTENGQRKYVSKH